MPNRDCIGPRRKYDDFKGLLSWQKRLLALQRQTREKLPLKCFNFSKAIVLIDLV